MALGEATEPIGLLRADDAVVVIIEKMDHFPAGARRIGAMHFDRDVPSRASRAPVHIVEDDARVGAVAVGGIIEIG